MNRPGSLYTTKVRGRKYSIGFFVLSLPPTKAADGGSSTGETGDREAGAGEKRAAEQESKPVC